MELKAQMFEGEDPKTIRDNLEAESYNVIKGEYLQHYTDEEIEAKHKELVSLDMEQFNLEVKLQEVSEPIRGEIKGLKIALKGLRSDIKTGGYNVPGNLYEIVDRVNKKVGQYNELGQLVNIRPMNRQERQLNISEISKAV